MGYKKYSDEFKRDVLAMAAEGRRSVAQLERDLDITPGLVYKWQQRYRVKGETLQASEDRAKQAELRRLQRAPQYPTSTNYPLHYPTTLHIR